MISGKLRIMGQIDVVELDQPGGQYGYNRALLIEFDSDEAIRKAINEECCRFSFGEPDAAPQPMTFSVQELRPEVLAFALLMEARLRQNETEKGTSWKQIAKSDLVELAASKCIRMERHQLDMRHPVDLANYCMMISDVAGVLKQSVELERKADNGGAGWVGLDQVQMS